MFNLLILRLKKFIICICVFGRCMRAPVHATNTTTQITVAMMQINWNEMKRSPTPRLILWLPMFNLFLFARWLLILSLGLVARPFCLRRRARCVVTCHLFRHDTLCWRQAQKSFTFFRLLIIRISCFNGLNSELQIPALWVHNSTRSNTNKN